MTDDEPVTVYSDYVCPFCYLGKASLEQYREEREDPPAVEWRPFDLRAHKRRPDGTIDDSVEDGKDDSYFQQVKENVRKLRERYDVEMIDFEDIPEDVDSWNAQLVSLAVREEESDEAFERVNDALFDALWRDARDVGDPDVLRAVVEDAGVDPEVVDRALSDDELEAELEARFEESQEFGITGVPTFIYDEYAARGAVPPEQLRRLVEGVQ